MQCAACRAVYSSALDICPRCQRPKQAVSPALTKEVTNAPHREPKAAAKATPKPQRADDAQEAAIPASSAVAIGGGASTLIEFPGTGRASANRPQWRKDLSERVREIQHRRAREAALEAERAALRELEQATLEADDELEIAPIPPLGLVASNDAAPLNPLVIAALRRIERARQPPPRPRAKASGGAAAAVARVVEEHYETPAEPAVAPAIVRPPLPRAAPIEVASEIEAMSEARPIENANRMTEAPRPSGLIIVQSVQPPKIEAQPVSQPESLLGTSAPIFEAKEIEASVASPLPAAIPAPVASPASVARANESVVSPPLVETTNKPVPRRVSAGVIDDNWLERREAEMHASAKSSEKPLDDRAPLAARFVGGVIDLVVITFIASPFAAIIELTSGAWSDARVAGSMVGIVVTLMLLYMVVSTGLAGRTFGMWLLSLRVVDVRTAMVPATGQSVRRAVAYIMSLAAFGLGFLYALLDAEGRAAHDHLSGTMVVRD
ncbi:MAG: RDD family protein [Pyrinomonadaceae bacterium]|nr:RDD family protein [Pyrinomonadaceae bacterium]